MYGKAETNYFFSCSTTDPSGNLYIVGSHSGTTTFPVLNQFGGAWYQANTPPTTNGQTIIIKFSNSGVRLWSTFYSGSAPSQNSNAFSVASDNNGNIFVAGRTQYPDFPTMPAAGAYYQTGTANAGNMDAYILKFSGAGIRLWATLFGGVDQSGTNGYDEFNSVDVAPNGNVVVTGYTQTQNFPVLDPGGGAYFQTNNTDMPGVMGLGDLIVVQFSNTGTRLWSTYVGGSSFDRGISIMTDIYNNIFIVGMTKSTNFVTFNPFGGAYYNGTGVTGTIVQGIILKFNSNGVILWSTYYGINTLCTSIAADNSGNIFVVCSTGSNSLPMKNPGGGAYFQNFAGGNDVYIVKFDNYGEILWATYYGASGIEGTGPASSFNSGDRMICVDDCGNVYLLFGADLVNCPTYNPSCNGFFRNAIPHGPNIYDGAQDNDADDGFILKFSNNGNLLWATYLNALTGEAFVFGSCCVDKNNALFLSFSWAELTAIPLLNPGGGAYFNTADIPGSAIMKFIPDPVSLSITSVNNSSACSCNGTATATLNCGTSLYNYSWSNGNSTVNSVNNTNTINGLCPGIYSVTATEACTTLTAQIIITGPPGGLNTSIHQTNVGCYGTNTGTAGITVTGGVLPYTYLWSYGSQTTPTITALAAGSYTCTVTDATGCTSVQVINIIQQPQTIKILTNITGTNCSALNSSIFATALGGTAPYNYTWSNGQNTSTATGLASGFYLLTVTDNAGCKLTQTITIGQPPPLYVDTLSINKTCTKNGYAMVTARLGMLPYTYSWNNGSSTTGISVSTPGGYTATVTDANGCTAKGVFDIKGVTQMSRSFTITPAKTVCVGSTVTFTGTASSGTSTWRLLSNNLLVTSGNGNIFVYTFNSPPGANTFIIEHGVQGCLPVIRDTIVVVNCPPGLPGISSAGGGCVPTGDCSKSIVASVAGGVPPYTYNWSTGATTSKIYPCATTNATYTVTVTDAAGATNTTTAAVIAGPSAALTKSLNGTVCVGTKINFTGQTSPGASYYWIITYPANVSGTTSNFSYTFLSAGNYPLRYSVSNGTCGDTKTDTIKVTNCSGPIIFATGSSICTGTCANVTSIGSGGTSPYTYAWSDGANTQNINPCPTATTTYTLTITDAGGTTATTTATVIVNPPIVGQFTKGTASCAACGCKEWLMVSATGGSSPYFYSWPDGYSQRYKNHLCPGNYTINIKDKNGCSVNVNLTTP